MSCIAHLLPAIGVVSPFLNLTEGRKPLGGNDGAGFTLHQLGRSSRRPLLERNRYWGGKNMVKTGERNNDMVDDRNLMPHFFRSSLAKKKKRRNVANCHTMMVEDESLSCEGDCLVWLVKEKQRAEKVIHPSFAVSRRGFCPAYFLSGLFGFSPVSFFPVSYVSVLSAFVFSG